MVEDQLAQNTSGVNFTIGEGKHGVCLPGSTPYFDLFSWTQDAMQNGKTKVIGGESCEIWELDAQFFGNDMHFSACIAADSVPRELMQTMHSGHVRYSFSNVRLGHMNDQIFKISEACNNYPNKPCESDIISTLHVYRVFGPLEPMRLENRNAGDILGDLSFMCTQGSSNSYRSKFITKWSVRVSNAWGQYSLCNYNGRGNVCSGVASQLHRVGRRASQLAGSAGGQGDFGGQCTPNIDVGSQYSFPEEGRCSPGKEPTPGGECVWGSVKPIRTVTAKCLMEDRGLMDVCSREFGHAPFSESAKIFDDAFASEDPAKGGCPDASPNQLINM